MRSDAVTIAAKIAESVSTRDAARAFRLFIQLADNLAAEHGVIRVALTVSEPASTGSDHWDAALAAVCEYRLNQESLPMPSWVHDTRRTLAAPWLLTVSDDTPVPVDIDVVPAEFRSRGVLFEAASLESY